MAAREARTTARFTARLSAWPRLGLMAIVRAYRLLLKPWLGNACRFEPTCSLYALGALQRHGALAGSALTGWRLLRCQPWCAGGCDPVPENLPRPAAGLFTRLHLSSEVAQPEPGAPHPLTRKLP
jgi:putative membrane protein insertion efficiency factor